jgi:hypothetical protein
VAHRTDHGERIERTYRIPGENLKTLAQAMAEFTFGLRYAQDVEKLVASYNIER